MNATEPGLAMGLSTPPADAPGDAHAANPDPEFRPEVGQEVRPEIHPATAPRVPGPPLRTVALLLGLPMLMWLTLVLASMFTRLLAPSEPVAENPQIAPAVIIAPVETGPLSRSRSFSGTLVSPAVLEASALVSGRVTAVEVRLGDVVEPGQALVRLDPEELEQSALAADAQLAVARANASEAIAAEAIAERAVARVRQLREEGLTSEAEADAAEAQRLAAAAAVEVAEARRVSAAAQAQTARIRRSYATIRARFSATREGETRRVAEVTVQEGDTVNSGESLVRLVQLDPLRAVFSATQADHAGLSPGQSVEITTDAYPGRTFPGSIDRLAPAFSISSRQARVEVDVANTDGLLRPGMFVRITTDLETLDDATSIPRDALALRDGQQIVFVLPTGAEAVKRVEVELGMNAGDRVQVLSPAIEGDVVVLGQQLLRDRMIVNPSRRLGETVTPKPVPQRRVAEGGA